MDRHDEPQATHFLDLMQDPLSLISGHLKLGGANPEGETIEFTNYYMLWNGKPCIPVMGEFHFSRYNHSYWEEELLKIKGGGIDIVATYVFWIHTEEEEGVFDWSNNNNLRKFIKLCDRHNVWAIVRIGPFAHGECRNGGLPDWLYGRPFDVRSNDLRYLHYVQRWYNVVAAQLEGLLFKDGGPVIGIQLENEYMHAGAPWEVTFRQGREWVPSGSDGVEHIATLKQMALSAGLEVPIYTCTGWLNSPIVEGETLPMQGGYAFTPWSPDPNFRQQPTREFLFRNRHLAPLTIGSPTYQAENYPYICCEIGAGIQDTYHHRPIVPPESVEAFAVMNLAGGANLIGYYMYHGGSNPVGKHSYMNEFTVPRISYDFQAPLGEFGQVNDSFRYLRLLHMFLKDFGELLAPMCVAIPGDAHLITPKDTNSLRYAARSKERAGFLFLNNYQDHVEMQDISGIQIELRTVDETVFIPSTRSLTLKKNVSAILPFGLSLDGVLLKYATTQLLTKIHGADGENVYVFFAPNGMETEYAFDSTTFDTLTVVGGDVTKNDLHTRVTGTPGTGCVITFTGQDGKLVRALTLTRDQAERCSKQTLGQRERLIISAATAVSADGNCYLHSIGQNEVSMSLYPPLPSECGIVPGAVAEQADGCFTRYTIKVPKKEIHLDVESAGNNKAVLSFPRDMLDNVNDVFLRIDYFGDIGNVFINGKLVGDNFHNGTVWEIGLKQFGRDLTEHGMFVLITPIEHKVGGYIPTGMAFHPQLDDERLAAINAIMAVPEYKIPIC